MMCVVLLTNSDTPTDTPFTLILHIVSIVLCLSYYVQIVYLYIVGSLYI